MISHFDHQNWQYWTITFPVAVPRQWLHGNFQVPLFIPIQYSISGTPVEAIDIEGTVQGVPTIPDSTEIEADKDVGEIPLHLSVGGLRNVFWTTMTIQFLFGQLYCPKVTWFYAGKHGFWLNIRTEIFWPIINSSCSLSVRSGFLFIIAERKIKTMEKLSMINWNIIQSNVWMSTMPKIVTKLQSWQKCDMFLYFCAIVLLSFINAWDMVLFIQVLIKF